MLRVLCSESELAEYGEVIAVGDHLRRIAGRRDGTYYGTELDTLEWAFDRYAELGGEHEDTISGTVSAIDAVYVRLTLEPGAGWTARLGSAQLESVHTTAATRRPAEAINWEPASTANEQRHSVQVGSQRIEEGTEHLFGWVFSLLGPKIGPSAGD